MNELYCEYNDSKCKCARTPPYKDRIYWFAKTCTMFALLSYKFMIINSFTYNLYGVLHTLLTATWHTPDALLWYGLQFLNRGMDKVMHILWMMRPLSDTSRKSVPSMLYWVEVWRPNWPVHHTDNLVTKERLNTYTVRASALYYITINASPIASAYGLITGSRISLRCVAAVINRTAWCYAVKTVQWAGRLALAPSWWRLYLTIWTSTFVAQWKSISSSCTYMIAMIHQYKKTVLYVGCHPGTVLILSIDVLSRLLLRSRLQSSIFNFNTLKGTRPYWASGARNINVE